MHLHDNCRASALALLVLRVFTDNHDFTLALDNLAFFTHLLDRRSDFHVYTLLMNCGVSFSVSLFGAPSDAPLRQIIRAHLERHLIAGQNADEIHAQLAGDVGENHVPARNLHLKRRVRQSFLNDSFYFNYVLF